VQKDLLSSMENIMTAKKVVSVAGELPCNIREMPSTDEIEDDEESWRDRPTLVPIVELLKRQMRLELQRLTDEQACFGDWMADNEACPEAADCDLSSFCKQAWQMASVEAGISAKPPPPPEPEPELAEAIVSEFAQGDPKARAALRAQESAKRTKRHKYAGQEKYTRTGYDPAGTRNVDKCVAAFVAALGNPDKLPRIWNRGEVKQELAKTDFLVISATKSYHAVMWQGTVIARFWTNAAKHGLVDLVTELIVPVKSYITTVKWKDEGKKTKPPITMPVKCPANSWMKLRPCTHRVTVRTPETAAGVAKAIVTKFGIRAE
jgi:hypothetical protein